MSARCNIPPIKTFFNCPLYFTYTNNRDRGWEPRSNGGRQETGYPRGWELGETGDKFCNIAQFFHNRKSTQRWEPLREGAGTRSTRYGKQEFQPPLSFPLAAEDLSKLYRAFLRRHPYVNISPWLTKHVRKVS